MDSYAAAGVDTTISARAKEQVKKLAALTYNQNVLSGVGFFGGLYEFKNGDEPVLVSHVDGVGTKLMIAAAMDKHDTVGKDIVNHCVNDILTSGASPLFFLDYIATGKMVPERIAAIAKGLSEACLEVGCVLIGGETAEMPGMYAGDDYDLAGFVVGVVEKSKIIMGKDVALGDIILGLPSNGVHTNGYSLVRKIFGTDKKNLDAYYPELGLTLGEELLKPHRCYHKELKPLLPLLKGIAHITGGGFVGNIPRVLPEGIAASIHTKAWTVPPIFTVIMEKGNVPLDEMYHVFNMGIGMVLIVSPSNVSHIKEALSEAIVIGESVKQPGNARVIIDGRGYRKDKVD
jgi:phosphoribosylformylglycinamidine cyclo-ligase